MDWKSAKESLKSKVKIETDLNTINSTYRFVKSVDKEITSGRYCYDDEIGYEVSIGQADTIVITWGMLEGCFSQLNNNDGYEGKFFKRQYPLQYYDHGCHVHAVGQIFVAAGLADYIDGAYRIKETI